MYRQITVSCQELIIVAYLHTYLLAYLLHVQLMVALKLTDSPVHLIGTSMGGGIAGVYASRYPDNVTLLTLICPTGKAV